MSESWHITNRGEAAKCTTKSRACRYGDPEEHFPSAEAARAEFEVWMKDLEIPPPITRGGKKVRSKSEPAPVVSKPTPAPAKPLETELPRPVMPVALPTLPPSAGLPTIPPPLRKQPALPVKINFNPMLDDDGDE